MPARTLGANAAFKYPDNSRCVWAPGPRSEPAGGEQAADREECMCGRAGEGQRRVGCSLLTSLGGQVYFEGHQTGEWHFGRRDQRHFAFVGISSIGITATIAIRVSDCTLPRMCTTAPPSPHVAIVPTYWRPHRHASRRDFPTANPFRHFFPRRSGSTLPKRRTLEMTLQ